MTIRFIAGLISLCFSASALVIGNMVVLMMIGEINRKKSDAKPISYFGYTPLKTLRVFGEYRNLYPEGRLHIYALGSVILALLGLVSVAVCIGVSGNP